jgi:hypothetical protein
MRSREAWRPLLAAVALLCASCGGGVVVDDSDSGQTATPEGPWTLSLAASPPGGGTVSADPALGSYPDATTVSVLAAPVAGYRFLDWQGDLAGSGNPATVVVEGDRTVTALFGRMSWTIAVYMNADNGLEANAIQDLNEMEAGGAEAAGITVLALLDRAPGYDTSNGDWTDTRLYRVRDDANGLDGTIVSERLAAAELGLAADTETELNLGDPAALAAFVRFAEDHYPAEHLALVVWGHGTGWRAGGGAPASRGDALRAAGFDDSSGGDPLYTTEIGAALEGRSVEVIGLDVCLGAMVEVAYELRSRADVLIGSEEVTAPDGWEYHRVLQRLAASDLSRGAFTDAVVEAFAERYASAAGSTISVIDLTRAEAVSDALNDLSDALCSAVTTNAARIELRGGLFRSVEDFYVTPGDLNLDLADLGRYVRATWDYADAEAGALEAAVASAVTREWHHAQGNPRAHGLAVHYVPLDGRGQPLPHDDAYVRGRVVASPLAFVADSAWVPDFASGTGLLYRLWYEVLP